MLRGKAKEDLLKLTLVSIFCDWSTIHNSLKYEAVGIHTHGHKIQNSGVRITNELLITINKWIEAFY
jgi:hypothetical protein